MDTQETFQVCYNKKTQPEEVYHSQPDAYYALTSEVSGIDWNFKHTNML